MNMNGPHASIFIRETIDESGNNSNTISNQNEKLTLQKVGSVFLSESHIDETLKKINNPDYKKASYIKKRIRAEQFENGIININLYVPDRNFALIFLDSLIIEKIDKIKQEEKLKLNIEYQKIREKIDSCWGKFRELEITYDKEPDIEKKINLDHQMDSCSVMGEELLMQSIMSAGKIPDAGYFILDNASWITKKH